MTHLPQPSRSALRLGASALCLATLVACGGGDDDTPTTASGSASVAAAPLVISGASPASLNGTLAVSTAQYESGSSNETLTTFAGTDPYCRVAAYALVDSGDGKKYYLELSFSKSSRSLGLLKFGDDATLATLARTASGAGVTVDVAQRRIGFNNVAVSSTGTTITLNGSLDYPTNVNPADRAACG